MNGQDAGPHLIVTGMPVPETWPAGWSGVAVQIGDATGSLAGDGRDPDVAYRQWVQRFGPAKVGVWVNIAPSTSVTLPHDLAQITDHPPYVVLALHGHPGIPADRTHAEAMVKSFRQYMPGAALAYSAPPTRELCAGAGIVQPWWDAVCDFSAPVLDLGTPEDTVRVMLREHLHPHPVIVGGEFERWLPVARLVKSAGLQCLWWGDGREGWQHWPAQYSTMHVPGIPDVPVADPLKPVERGTFPGGAFIAWDGKGWHMTDLLWRRPLSRDTVAELYVRGVAVLAWPEVTELTCLVV